MKTAIGNALVIGQGSIGQRHARLLRERGCQVSVVSAHMQGAFRSVGDAISEGRFDHAVIATVTSQHHAVALDLREAGFDGAALIEKPLCVSFEECDRMAEVASGFGYVAVGYNLRFHPVIRALKEALEGQQVYEARISVGQFLPDWRPGTSFRDGSSARTASGGGALRDLSHEIDLAMHLLGPCLRLVASGGNLGRLDIETDEAWAVIMRMQSGALVQMSLNYYDRPARRSIAVTTAKESIVGDLVAGWIGHDGETDSFVVERDDSYKALHDALFRRSDDACSIEEAIGVMRVIDAIEVSQREERWVQL